MEARRAGIPLKSLGEFAPRDAAEAYAVQDAVADALDRAVPAWKTGASSPDAEAGFAPIFELAESPAEFPASALRLYGIEAEIAFRLGQDLGPRDEPYRPDEVAAAIASAHPAVELVETRFIDFDAADPLEKLADNGSNAALILGPAMADWRGLDLARPPVVVSIDGKEAARSTGNTGGDPLRLLAALADHLGFRRGGLRKGEVVTTGSCSGLVFAVPGARVVADFGPHGKVELCFPEECGS